MEEDIEPRVYPDPPARWCRFCNANHVAIRAQFRRHIKQCQETYWNAHRAKHGRILGRNHALRNPGRDYTNDAT